MTVTGKQIDGLVLDCDISRALTMEILQSWTKQSKFIPNAVLCLLVKIMECEPSESIPKY